MRSRRYSSAATARLRRRARRGQSLLELVAAATLIATALVPALQIMGEGLRISEEVTTASFMTSVCVSRLEEEMAKTSATWSQASSSGDYSAVGRPQVRYTVTKSDAVADGGMPDALMAITVSVWNDTNGDSSPDAGEATVTFGTKVSKLRNYQDTASE